MHGVRIRVQLQTKSISKIHDYSIKYISFNEDHNLVITMSFKTSTVYLEMLKSAYCGHSYKAKRSNTMYFNYIPTPSNTMVNIYLAYKY